MTDHDQSANAWEDSNRLAGALIVARLPSVNVFPAEESRPYDFGPSFHHDLDLSVLVTIRRAHETQRAKKSVRTQVQDDGVERSEQHSNSGKEPSIRQKIFREMTQVLREDQDQRKNTGANRAATWKSSAPGGRDVADIATLTGNSANAELAAGQRSLTASGIWILLPSNFTNICYIKVINRRRKFFTQYNVPRAIELAASCIGWGSDHTSTSTQRTEVRNARFRDCR